MLVQILGPLGKFPITLEEEATVIAEGLFSDPG